MFNANNKLSEFARILATVGPKSLEARQFLQEHAADAHFQQLARLATVCHQQLAALQSKRARG